MEAHLLALEEQLESEERYEEAPPKGPPGRFCSPGLVALLRGPCGSSLTLGGLPTDGRPILGFPCPGNSLISRTEF